MNKLLLLILLALPIMAEAVERDANGRIVRSRTEIARFKRMHPCPSTGLPYGACAGWIIDHHVGLCVGGLDKVSNMRWMSVVAAKAKDRWECRPGWEAHLQKENPL